MTGADMKAARERLGLTKAQLAASLGLGSFNGRNTIANLEKLDTIPDLHRLAIERLVERKKNGR